MWHFLLIVLFLIVCGLMIACFVIRSKSGILYVPIAIHSLNDPSGMAMADAMLVALSELESIFFPQAGITFVHVGIDSLTVPQFIAQETSIFRQYPESTFHVFLVPFIAPRVHGRAFLHQRPSFCAISFSNSGISLARTIGHEFGHLNGLPHTSLAMENAETLMLPGGQGSKLTDQEVSILRAHLQLQS